MLLEARQIAGSIFLGIVLGFPGNNIKKTSKRRCYWLKGIYFINDRICLNGLTKEESRLLQEQSIEKYMKEQSIQPIKLNPYQLNEYYTIPHALLYDLKKVKSQFDYFIHYSQQAVEDFMYTYPAKWLILKSYFKEIIVIENQNDLSMQNIS